MNGKSFPFCPGVIRVIEPNLAASSNPRNNAGRVLTRITILVLLFAVAGLATGAKNSQYYPHTNSVHYLSSSSKAKVAPAPVLTDRNLLRPVAKVIPLQPAIQTGHENQTEAPPVQQLCVTIALQLRSPPQSPS
jgi:hypothetical protein